MWIMENGEGLEITGTVETTRGEIQLKTKKIVADELVSRILSAARIAR